MLSSSLKLALSKVPAGGDSGPSKESKRLAKLCDLFLERYGDGPVKLIRAPARINVLGEHVDYVSYVPTASLTFGSRERDTLMLYRESPQPVIRSASTSTKYPPSSFPIVEGTPRQFGENIEADWVSFLYEIGTPEPHWQNYVRGAVNFARGKYGQQITKGFDFAVDSNIPPGGGASSSSALVVLGGAAIREVNGISFGAKELAHDSARAEWYIGTRGGSMDHLTICLARQTSAVLIGYSTKQTQLITLPDTPFQWITFFSTPADKGREVMIEYNERAAVSRLLIPSIIDGWRVTDPEIHRVWGKVIEALSDGRRSALDTAEQLLMNLPETIALDSVRVDYPSAFVELDRQFPALLTAEDRWPLRLRDRALHHLGEIRRVSTAALMLETLQEKQNHLSTVSTMRSIGLLLNESHNSLRDLYDVSTDEVERLLEIIRSDIDVFGVRLMGGGFGGNVLALTTQDHSNALIDRVQTEYYKPQQRNGAQEGSVMVSTPGDGLSQIDFNSLWRKVISHDNSNDRSTTLTSSNIPTLLDALPVDLKAEDIWPVIVAAGKGTRAAASGLEVAKPLALVQNKPAIKRVLENIRLGLGKTRPPVVIVSPETEAAVRKALGDQDVRFVLQPEPGGTGDAVFHARELLADFKDTALVVWSTQPVIRPETFERAVKLARLYTEFEMVIPTTLREQPYAPLHRDELGRIRSAQETHLEGAEAMAFGETNIGLFVLKNLTMFEVLTDLRSRYWDQKTNRYRLPSGELGFPNELVTVLAQRENGVFACPIADTREEQGIKRLDDVAQCEKFIDELELEQT